jgi:hypothetical protein
MTSKILILRENQFGLASEGRSIVARGIGPGSMGTRKDKWSPGTRSDMLARKSEVGCQQRFPGDRRRTGAAGRFRQ